MNLIRCNNGHYYDSDVYATCPHCQGSGAAVGSDNATIGYPNNMAQDEGVTVRFDGSGVSTPPPVSAADPISYPEPDDDNKTVSIYQNKSVQTATLEPTVGWLVCTKGNFFGQDFRLKSGKNFIGRNSDMDVALTGEASVSRVRHAIIIHEPKQNLFIAQPGEARELFYLNGNVILSPVPLKKNDRLQIGDVELMMIPCCDEVFNWPMGE